MRLLPCTPLPCLYAHLTRSHAYSMMAARTVLLPAFEPILWVCLTVSAIRAGLLSYGPYPTPPEWFKTAVYATSDKSAIIFDSVMYFLYWFTFEVMADGFAILMFQRTLSKAALRSTLSFTILVSVVMSVIVTVSFNFSTLGLEWMTQRVGDSIFCLLPCLFYLYVLFVKCNSRSPRSSVVPYAVFSMTWRILYGVAILASVAETFVGATILVLRSIGIPLMMYVALVQDTQYWRSLGRPDASKSKRKKTGRAAPALSGMGSAPGQTIVPSRSDTAVAIGSGTGNSAADGTAKAPLSGTAAAIGGAGGYGSIGSPFLSDTSSVASSVDDDTADYLQHLLQDEKHKFVDFAFLAHREVIGRGATADVYRGLLRGSPVAIKVFSPEGGITAEVVAQFAKETSITAALQHPNVVQFIGLCVAPPRISMVFELCERGSLYDLFRDGDPGWEWERKLGMLRDLARAVVYLHSFEPPYIHRDIKSPNLLVAHDFTLKLADFGESRFLASEDEASTMTSMVGTTQWMAPEMMESGSYTTKADVYSMAVVFWEILTGERPYAGLRATAVIKRVVIDKKRPPIPESCPPQLRDILAECWAHSESRRPDAAEVLKRLDDME